MIFDKNNAVYLLLKESLDFSCLQEDVFDCDWFAVYEEMKSQSVAALPLAWLRKNTINNIELQKKWIKDCIENQGRWVRVMHEQQLLLELLDKHPIPCVVIKGSAAAMVYPHPSLRAVGDIDILVKRADYDRAASLLDSNGYSLLHDKDPESHHYGYSKEGVSIELHKRLAIIDEDDVELMPVFEKGIENRIWHKVENISFPTLPDGLNGLVLLFHIYQHLRSGLGLRHIIDWMMYLNKYDNWNELLPVLRKTGMDKLALTITVMCQKYLGLKMIVEESEEYPCDELMDYIMEK